MSESFRPQIWQHTDPNYRYHRLLTTEEAAEATGLSQYELRRGGKEGRYPVILLGSPSKQFRKMRWNLDALNEAILQQMNQSDSREDDR